MIALNQVIPFFVLTTIMGAHNCMAPSVPSASLRSVSVPAPSRASMTEESPAPRAMRSASEPPSDRAITFGPPVGFQDGTALSVEITTKQDTVFAGRCTVVSGACSIAMPPYLLNESQGGACIRPADEPTADCIGVYWSQVQVGGAE